LRRIRLSFRQARLKLHEHYGFEIGESRIQRITLAHAQAMHAQAEAGLSRQEFPQTLGRHKEIVAQTDGGTIPLVEPDAGQKDKRKGKTLAWREAKLCLSALNEMSDQLLNELSDGSLFVQGAAMKIERTMQESLRIEDIKI